MKDEKKDTVIQFKASKALHHQFQLHISLWHHPGDSLGVYVKKIESKLCV